MPLPPSLWSEPRPNDRCEDVNTTVDRLKGAFGAFGRSDPPKKEHIYEKTIRKPRGSPNWKRLRIRTPWPVKKPICTRFRAPDVHVAVEESFDWVS